MVIEVENNNVEKGIRRLRKLSSEHLAEIKYRTLFPKKSERVKMKKRRAERKRLQRESRMKGLQVRHDRWLMVQRKRENRKRRVELHGN